MLICNNTIIIMHKYDSCSLLKINMPNELFINLRNKTNKTSNPKVSLVP